MPLALEIYIVSFVMSNTYQVHFLLDVFWYLFQTRKWINSEISLCLAGEKEPSRKVIQVILSCGEKTFIVILIKIHCNYLKNMKLKEYI